MVFKSFTRTSQALHASPGILYYIADFPFLAAAAADDVFIFESLLKNTRRVRKTVFVRLAENVTIVVTVIIIIIITCKMAMRCA